MRSTKFIQGSVKAVAGLTCGMLGGWILAAEGFRNGYVAATCVGMLASAGILLKQACGDFQGEP